MANDMGCSEITRLKAGHLFEKCKNMLEIQAQCEQFIFFCSKMFSSLHLTLSKNVQKQTP